MTTLFTRKIRCVVTLAASILGTLIPTSARADYEAWTWTEARTTVVDGSKPGAPLVALRLWTDARFSRRAGGLQQLFLRVGPIVRVTPWMFVAAHGTAYADRIAPGKFEQEIRGELEPNFHGRLGDFTFNDRNRFEVRWRDSGVRTRYRNQLRFNYAPEGARFYPFLWDEVLVDLSGAGLNQNRAALGLGWVATPRLRVEGSFMVRSREDMAGWTHDRIAVLYLFVDGTR